MEARNQLKQAERGAKTSIAVYILLSFAKLLVGYLFYSTALFADGLNNFTDVISSILVLFGLKIAQKPVDKDHPYGHWKFETIASLMTSFIMFYVGIEVLKNVIQRMWLGAPTPTPSLLNAVVAAGAGIVMLLVYRYNKNLAKRLNSLGLKAASKDNLSDALTSFTTAIAIVAASSGILWIDDFMALVVGIIIIKTAIEIFKESTFELTDGFEEDKIHEYETIALSHPEVKAIGELKARRYGSNVYIDLTVLMDPNLTVYDSHAVTEEIEEEFYQQSSVLFIDIHVEPYEVDSAEI
ncbi:cation diffusion facilitator family transporter [Granulicatella balaenopterae]|uniref:Cation diffusion facilitator family transporter n=1 Tax=Granulicatella balaenopterae TaxID=137733 RepID=A0A1H9JKN6_9LACT|nr:cation diffusion facilitator family transporter [Granulicatella balaenopterae]SEQ87396.1 cation diffusion facilitator family transporter [Granulicatella balaenopterae]